MPKKMCDASPTKRRKTKGTLAMTSVKASWPANELPVEIFALIIAYLPRSNIQNMRLVNKEFEEKVAQVLFRSVVVPFKPEIYGISSEPVLAKDIQGSIMLQDKGMRVFQGFGRWIQRFAMSFEIDQNKLANPPTKSDQEAITSFWGIYRWPFKSYNRYTQLEGLEQTADETRSMAKALRFISRAEELGLSIDGGLGWLSGPDTNLRAISRPDKFPVFGASRFVPELKVKQSKMDVGQASHNQNGGLVRDMKRILEEAGYEGEDLDYATGMLLESEGILFQINGRDDPFREAFQLSSSLQDNWRQAHRRYQISNEGGAEPTFPYTDLQYNPRFGDVDEDGDLEIARSATLTLSNQTAKVKADAYPLKPNDLSNAQREMLLEMEWAQSAFMQSWAIAVIDNTATFRYVRTLTISRLPHRHLSVLCRRDFWKSLPSLNCFSLAVVPDWREVKKEATSWVQDSRLAPSQSLPGVYRLLHEFVSNTKNITSLHFEWICGGEYAPGMFARNQLILAAPIVSTAMDMVNRTGAHPVLSLPFIEHLSLKNCWLSPHILKKLLYPMKAGLLKSLSFDSVSLTASIAPNAQPGPIAQAVQNPQIAQNMAAHAAAHAVHAAQFQNMNNFPAGGWQGAHNPQNNNIQIQLQAPPPAQAPQPATVQVIDNGSNWLQAPRLGSWPDIIDNMSPGITLAEIRFERDIGTEPKPREPTCLKKLIFNSCGYVRLPLDFDQSSIDHSEGGAQTATNTTRRMSDIEPYMMKPLEPTLGTIVNGLNHVEKATLENAWNLTIGWDRSKIETVLDAQLDGIAHAGHGRFEGIIEAPLLSSRRY